MMRIARSPSRRRPLLRGVVGLAVWVALVQTGCGPGPVGDRPDVIVIVADTLRRDRLGSYGYPRDLTPALDRLAQTSIRFTRWYSPSAWTTPAVAALLASQYPPRLGIRSIEQRLADEFVLLPEILQTHGYETHAVVGNTLLNTRWGFNQGFDHFDEELTAEHRRSVTSEAVSRKAAQILAQPRTRPRFLLLHYFDPHSDYMRHDVPEIARIEQARDVGGFGDEVGPGLLRELPREKLRPANLRYVRDLYDREVAFMDHWIGFLIQTLRDLDRFDDTLVIFTSDHGEEFLDHGSFGHARTVFDELIRVPTLIKLPGQREPAVDDALRDHVDLLPTVLEVLQIPVEHGIAGSSALAHEVAPRPRFSESNDHSPYRAAIGPRFKLVHDERRDRYRLLDLDEPVERRDVAADHPAELDTLRKALDAWKRANVATPGASDIEMTDREREQLDALGYLN